MAAPPLPPSADSWSSSLVPSDDLYCSDAEEETARAPPPSLGEEADAPAPVSDDEAEAPSEDEAGGGGARGLATVILRLQKVLLTIAAMLFVWGGAKAVEGKDGDGGESGNADDDDPAIPSAVKRTALSLRTWAPKSRRRYVRHAVSNAARGALADLARGAHADANPPGQALLAESRAAAAAFVAGLEHLLGVERAVLANELLEQCSLDWSLRVSSGTPPAAPVPDAMAHDELLRVVFFTSGVETAHAQRVRANAANNGGDDAVAARKDAPGAVVVPGPAVEAATAGRVLTGDTALVAVARPHQPPVEMDEDDEDDRDQDEDRARGPDDDVVAVAVLTATRADGTPLTPLACLPFYLTADEVSRYGSSQPALL